MKHTLKTLAFFFLTTLIFASCQKEEVVQPTYQKPPVADAGNAQIVVLPGTTAYLTGTATSTNGPIYGYLWSLISGPNVPTIETPSSSTTKVSNLILGTYKFQFLVSDSAGLVGIDTTTITVKPISIVYQTLTLQPANNSYEGLLNVFYPNLFQSGSQLLTEAWTSGGSPFTVRTMIKFDYSSIPTGAVIDNASLYLYSDHAPLNGNLTDANFGSNNSFYIQRITSSWSLPTVFTWNNPPASVTTNQVTVPQSNSSFEDITANMTQLVKDQITNGNNGVIMKLVTESTYNIRQFYSSKYTGDITKLPKLVINYHY